MDMYHDLCCLVWYLSLVFFFFGWLWNYNHWYICIGIDGAEKSPVSHTVFACLEQCPHNKKRRSNREHRCGAGKYPSNVKLKLFHNSRVPKLGWIMRTFFWGSLGFCSDVESNSFACATSLFLMEKIFINACISWNPPFVRFLVVLEIYGLGLIFRHKSFPFRISWRPYNDQLNVLFDSSTLRPFT